VGGDGDDGDGGGSGLGWEGGSGGFSALLCSAHTQDFPPSLIDRLKAEFEATVAPVLLNKRTSKAQRFVDAIRTGDVLEQAVMESRLMMQK
jgi:hypothetical protein